MDNEQYMKRALELARNGEGLTSPNPLVGAVIVKDDQIIGEGWHERYGGPHAEINAIRSLKASAEGATIFVTLEPCSHYGKTPPCVDAIIENGFSKVVIAMLDPNPLVAGRSIKKLEANGIEVVMDVMSVEAQRLNEPFVKYITTSKPLMVLKTAMTLDGKIASVTGDSRWISSESSRKYTHQLRNRYSGIMVGIGTVLADNPTLTARPGIDPHRIIVDSNARIPLSANVLNIKNSEGTTIIATTQHAAIEKRDALESLGAKVLVLPDVAGKVDLRALVVALGKLSIDSVLVEGGSELNFSLLEAGLIDKVISFIAPKIIGGRSAKTPVGGEGIPIMNHAIAVDTPTVSMMGGDILIEGFIVKEASCLQD